MQLLHREGDRMDLLHKLRTDHLSDGATARARDEDSCVFRRDVSLKLHALEELKHLFRLPRLMPLVVLPQGFVRRRIHNDGLDGCRTNIQSYKKVMHSVDPRPKPFASMTSHPE